MRDVRVHDLRHSFSSRALAPADGLPVIRKLLDHPRVHTSARYAPPCAPFGEGPRYA